MGGERVWVWLWSSLSVRSLCDTRRNGVQQAVGQWFWRLVENSGPKDMIWGVTEILSVSHSVTSDSF